MNSIEQINIQIHPRAFSSFGEDLVTNDIVAITELVKMHMMHMHLRQK